MVDEKTKYEYARKVAIEKLGFIKHAIAYVIVITFLAIINNVIFSPYQWWIWPALIWGIFVIINFISAFFLQSGKLVEKMTKKEMEKIDE